MAGSPGSALGPKGCATAAPGAGHASSPGASGGPPAPAGATRGRPWLTPMLTASTIVSTGIVTSAASTPNPVSRTAAASFRFDTSAPTTRSAKSPARALRPARPTAAAVLTALKRTRAPTRRSGPRGEGLGRRLPLPVGTPALEGLGAVEVVLRRVVHGLHAHVLAGAGHHQALAPSGALQIAALGLREVERVDDPGDVVGVLLVEDGGGHVGQAGHGLGRGEHLGHALRDQDELGVGVAGGPRHLVDERHALL